MKKNMQKTLTSIPQDSQGHQKQGKSEKLNSQEEAKETLTTKCNVVSWLGSWKQNKKRTLG